MLVFLQVSYKIWDRFNHFLAQVFFVFSLSFFSDHKCFKSIVHCFESDIFTRNGGFSEDILITRSMLAATFVVC